MDNPVLREATRSSIPQTNLTIDFWASPLLLPLFIFSFLHLIISPCCTTTMERGGKVSHHSPRCRPSIVAKPTTLRHPDKMPKKRGKRSSTANGGTPGGTRARKGKKTQKSVRLTNFDEARNFLHGVALTPEAFYAKDENMSKSLLQCVKLYFDHDKKNAEESTQTR